MKHRSMLLAAALLALAGAAPADETIIVDLSHMAGSQAAFQAWPLTNRMSLYPYTNSLSSRLTLSTNVAPYTVETMIQRGVLTNVVKRLVSGGHVCAVIGHKWESGCGQVGCLVLHAGPMRHCLVCGKVQTQAPGEWK